MRDIFFEYAARIEPLSLDEAYLDVSEAQHHHGSATLIAREIKQRIRARLGISVSAGVAPVKFLAKIASDWDKPDGLFVIDPKSVDQFVLSLGVSKLPGVGPVTAKKMARNGIYTCRDIQNFGLQQLIRLFGAYGPRLYRMSKGMDDHVVGFRSRRKSLSVERTFEKDFSHMEPLLPMLDELLASLARRYEKFSATQKINKAFVKLKFSDFSITTIEAAFSGSRRQEKAIFERLLYAAWQRKKMPIRLLGVGFRLRAVPERQLQFDFD